MAPQPFYEDRGTPIAVAHLLRALSQHGYHVDLLTFPTGRSLDIPYVNVIRLPNIFGFKRVPIGFSLSKLVLDGLMWLEMRKLLRRRRYVAIHAVEEAAFLAVLGRSYHVPVIYDMQSSLPEQLAGKRSLAIRPLLWFFAACERWLLERVDEVACSAGLAAHVRRVAPRTPVREWRYPPQPAVHDSDSAELRRCLKVPETAPLVVYAGTFEPYQGIDELLRAVPAVLNSVPEARFILVGADAKRFRMARHQVAELRIQESVQVIERQPRDSVPPYLAMADVLVVPRAYGLNIPLKLFDYFGAGKPIVASGDAVLQMQDAPARLVRVQHSSHALATGLVKVLRERVAAFRSLSAAKLMADNDERRAAFLQLVDALYRDATHRNGNGSEPRSKHAARRVSVVIPAHNEQDKIAQTIGAVCAQDSGGWEIEVIVADDGSTDGTAGEAARAGARVVICGGHGGNPGAARNTGAAHATGETIVFLDADCVPQPGWLYALLDAHQCGHAIVGGALGPAGGNGFIAACDYYASSYFVHPWQGPGMVPNHPPANISVRRAAFFGTSGFAQEAPVCDGHEELVWQAELREAGVEIFFEPRALALHRNRGGLGNLLRRNYRWAYSMIQSKAEHGNARMAGLYRYPYFMIIASLPVSLAQLLVILGCWLRARRFTVFTMVPVLLLSRLAYAAGMSVGGWRWLRNRSPLAVRSSLVVR